MTTFLVTILILAPLAAALFGYIFRKGTAWPPILGVSFSLITSARVWISLSTTTSSQIEFGGVADFPFLLTVNSQNALLALVVAVVGLAIFIYAKGYMHDKKGKEIFWPAMSLFLGSMQLLVWAGDWFLFITGWEVMGLASFLLIGSWHENNEARRGSVKAFLLTRIADMGLYLGAFLIVIAYDQLAIPFSGNEEIPLLTACCFLFAVMGKSAQVPFQDWLLGAMAGPTPVSALLHSATMVGAGALLLFKIYPILPEDGLLYIGIIGSITIVLTGMTAITAKDIKQMLAASTSSQLGFMLLAVGAGFPGAAFGHWLAHAFMKSTLFLDAGVFQQGNKSTLYQKIAGSGRQFKWAFWTFVIAVLALAGIPPFIGYWSKDTVVAASFLSGNWFFAGSALIGTLFTAIYSAKAVRWLWKGKPKSAAVSHKKWMLTGIFMLSFVIIVGGFFLETLIRKTGYSVPKNTVRQLITLALAISGLVVGWFYRESWLSVSFINFSKENYPVAGGYQVLVVNPVLKTADAFARLDTALLTGVEKIGRFGLGVSKTTFQLDKIAKRAVLGIGNAGLGLSNLSEAFDDRVLKSIESIAATVKESGARGRKWQSGLIHKELAITIVSLLILIFIVTVSLIQFL